MARRYKGPRLTLNIAAQPERVNELRAVEAVVHVLDGLQWTAKQRVIATALVLLGDRQSEITAALDMARS